MSAPQFDIVVGGSLHLDIMVNAPLLPRVDETKMGSEWGMKCGGKGGNQAVMATKTGAKVAMIGAIGEDDFGRRLIENLDEAGVDRRAVRIDPDHGSGMSVAILQDDGEYGAVVVSGANKFMAASKMDEAWQTLGGGRVLVLQNEIPESVNLALARVASASGAKILLNAAPFRALPPELVALTDCLVLNRIEASEFFNSGIETAGDAASVLKARRSDVGGAVIVTLGARGLVVAISGSDPVFIPPVPVTLISAHGAGDCFVGVLAASLSRGLDLVAAAERANKSAAQYVAVPEHDRAGLAFDLG